METPTEAEVIEWMTSLSNWGRWGQDDQAGCLNLITSNKRRQAAALIREGVTVSCSRPVVTDMAPDVAYQVQRYMVDSQEGRETDPPERRRTRRGASEFIGMVFHGQTITHIDALSHYSWEGILYNGAQASLVTSREGAQTHSVEPASGGHSNSRCAPGHSRSERRALAGFRRSCHARRSGSGREPPWSESRAG